MIFASKEFFLFLPVVLFAYHLLPSRGSKYTWLLGASWLFYAKCSPGYFWVLFALTVIDYLAGIQIERCSALRQKKFWLRLSILANLGLLASFKYTVFFYDNTLAVSEWFGYGLGNRTWDILLPLGISFHTFQGMSYTLDVYRGKIAAVRNFRDYALFVAFFPQLAAGPIVRAVEFLPQMIKPPKVTSHQIEAGLLLLVIGLFKKLVIADHLHLLIVDPVFSNPSDYSVSLHWLATIAWAAQIYCDFSGYTDIAIGSAKLFGFELPANFHLPYLATNIADFWRRWHISFSFWLRDYLYFPLGGSRKGEWRTQLNLMIVFVLCGLWHGATWSWLIYGAYNGILMSIHRQWDRLFTNSEWRQSYLWSGISWLFTFHQLLLGLILIRMPSWDDGIRILVSMLTLPQLSEYAEVPATVWLLLTSAFAGHFIHLARSTAIVPKLETPYRSVIHAASCSILILGLLTLTSNVSKSFIYIAF